MDGGSGGKRKRKRKNQRAVNAEANIGATSTDASGFSPNMSKWKHGGLAVKARSLMNLHNNEAGRRVSFSLKVLYCFLVFFNYLQAVIVS